MESAAGRRDGCGGMLCEAAQLVKPPNARLGNTCKAITEQGPDRAAAASEHMAKVLICHGPAAGLLEHPTRFDEEAPDHFPPLAGAIGAVGATVSGVGISLYDKRVFRSACGAQSEGELELGIYGRGKIS